MKRPVHCNYYYNYRGHWWMSTCVQKIRGCCRQPRWNYQLCR